MKNLFILFLVFLLPLGSCDEIENLADVSFETTLTKTIPVAAATTDPTTSSVVLDATADPEVQKYASKIKGYEITELTFAIENFNGPTITSSYFNGVIGFSKKNDASATETCNLGPIDVKAVAGTGVFTINPCSLLKEDIATLMSSENAVKIYMTGTFTEAPLSFDLIVTAKVKVTANPL